MDDRIGLFDRDIFIKLACCDLWDQTLTAYSISSVLRPASLDGESSSRRLIARKVSSEMVDASLRRLQAMVANSSVVPSDVANLAEESHWYSVLANCQNIGPADATLLCQLICLPPNTLMFTGDKRCLSDARKFVSSLYFSVEGRIITFELCLQELIKMHGVEFVVAKVSVVPKCDGVIPLALGSAIPVDLENFESCIASYASAVMSGE